MTIKEQENALAESLGWIYLYDDEYGDTWFRTPSDENKKCLLEYSVDLNLIAAARKKLINTPKLKYTYTNHIRDIIAKKPETPKNKAGQALVSDFDCINAESQEHLEALVRVLKPWKD